MRLQPETRNMLSRLTGVIKNVLFPVQCLVCGAFFHNDSHQRNDLPAEVFEEPCSPAERDFRYAPSSFLQGMFCLAAVLRSDCKESCQFFDSLANPAVPLSGISATLHQASCGECARCAVQAGTAPDFEKVMAPFLCRLCSKDFNVVVSPMCTVCGIMFQSREGQDHICGECLTSPKPFGMARSLGAYERALLAVIHRMKYAGKVQVARPLGALLFLTLIRYWKPGSIDLVIPVPLHSKKIRTRGFNQSFLLVRGWKSMAAALNIEQPFIKVDGRALIRNRWTEPQTGLGKKKRLANIKKAFSVSDPTRIAGKKILLVDDVYTTGATVGECARVLLGAGARRVDVLTLAQAL